MKTLKTLILVVTTMAAAIASTAALAHTDDYLDTQPAPNGGQTRMAGAYHFELVVAKDSKEVKENPVIVYVTDHAGAKASTVGAGGTATLLAGKTKATITLTPDGDNRLKGVGKYASSPNLKAVVSITLAGKSPEQARFTPLAPAKPAPAAKATEQHDHSGHKH